MREAIECVGRHLQRGLTIAGALPFSPPKQRKSLEIFRVNRDFVCAACRVQTFVNWMWSLRVWGGRSSDTDYQRGVLSQMDTLFSLTATDKLNWFPLSISPWTNLTSITFSPLKFCFHKSLFKSTANGSWINHFLTRLTDYNLILMVIASVLNLIKKVGILPHSKRKEIKSFRGNENTPKF